MEKSKVEKRNITVHWWNCGTKTLDHDGTVKDFLKKKDIKVTKISHKSDKSIKGYRFKIPLASSITTLDIFNSDYVGCVNAAIKIFLTLLGDKQLYNSPYGVEYRLNW